MILKMSLKEISASYNDRTCKQVSTLYLMLEDFETVEGKGEGEEEGVS